MERERYDNLQRNYIDQMEQQRQHNREREDLIRSEKGCELKLQQEKHEESIRNKEELIERERQQLRDREQQFTAEKEQIVKNEKEFQNKREQIFQDQLNREIERNDQLKENHQEEYKRLQQQNLENVTSLRTSFQEQLKTEQAFRTDMEKLYQYQSERYRLSLEASERRYQQERLRSDRLDERNENMTRMLTQNMEQNKQLFVATIRKFLVLSLFFLLPLPLEKIRELAVKFCR